MNLIEILRSRIDSLPKGEHTRGVESVLLHVEVAARHFERGRASQDETAFTDAIYRTNQAYEGSLKEAYRVLAQKDPAKKTPNNIEEYLQAENILRSRVLTQLTNYRTEWRNPSTHDYKLDFNEDESLLAIFNVSAFAIMLTDQIAQKLAFEESKSSTAVSQIPEVTNQSLLDELIGLLPQFLAQFNALNKEENPMAGVGRLRESQIVGALGGFLSASRPGWDIQSGLMFPSSTARIDMFVVSGEEKLLLEVKRVDFTYRSMREQAINQVASYMELGKIKQSLILGIPTPNTGTLSRLDSIDLGEIGQIHIITAYDKLPHTKIPDTFFGEKI